MWGLKKKVSDDVVNRLDNSYLITENDIRNNGLKWCCIDTLEKCLNDTVFIINSDLSNGVGQHWFTIYLKNDLAYIIDSLGPNNYRQYDNIMFKILINNGFKIRFYPYKFQMNNSNKCGFFSIYVAKLIQKMRYPSFDVIEHELIKLFGRSPDMDDEKVLINGFGVNKI